MGASTNPPTLTWDILVNNFAVKAPVTPSPENGVVSSDVSVDPARNIWFRLYVPSAANAAKLPVIVYYHGGGFLVWSPDCKPYDNLCRKMAVETPAVVVSVNYRLTPDHRCPTQYEDGFEALRFLDRNPNFNGFPANADLGKCFISGDSAGGNLAHHVAVKASECEDFKAVKVIGLVPIQPFFTAKERSDSELRMKTDPILTLERTDHFWEQFLPEGSDRDHPACSVFGPNGKDISPLRRFPKTLVFTGGSDPLQDWGKKYHEWLLKSGKDAKLIHYPNAPHCFYSSEEMPDFSPFIKEVVGFVHKVAA